MNINLNFYQLNTGSPAFKSKYEIDANSVRTRKQIYTMGMLMSSPLIYNPRNKYPEVKRKNIYGKLTVDVKDAKDKTFETILKNNQIDYKKV